MSGKSFPASAGPMPIFSFTVPGINAEVWKTSPIFRRSSITGGVSIFSPLRKISPASIDSSRFKQRNSEVLPEPDGPSTTRISPCASSKETLLRMGFSRVNEISDTVSIYEGGRVLFCSCLIPGPPVLKVLRLAGRTSGNQK